VHVPVGCSVTAGSGIDEVVGSSVEVGTLESSVDVGTLESSVLVSSGSNVVVTSSPGCVGLGWIMTVINSVSVAPGASSVHVALGSDPSSVEVGSEPSSVEVGSESSKVVVGLGSVNESVGSTESVPVELGWAGPRAAVAVLFGGLLTPKSTETSRLPISVCASVNKIHETNTPVLSEAGTARQVVFAVQGVISQFPSCEQVASWEEMQPIWVGVQASSNRKESKKKLEPCAISAGVVGSARTARAAMRDQIGIAVVVDAVKRSAARVVVAVVVENMLISGMLLKKKDVKK